jgi:urea carboxylase-associated protein 1
MPAKDIQHSPRLPEQAMVSATVGAGDPFVHEVLAGQYIRIVDLAGNQAVDTLFYNARDYADRYSAQDTIREQQNIYLTTGTRLISTRRNVLLTIVADTCGRHDTLGGACSCESNMVRYAIEKRSMHACRQTFLKGAIGWSQQSGHPLDKRDLTANINFFMNVPVTSAGQLTFADGVSDAGKYVELRAEMDVLIVISNCPQLNNPCNAYNPTPIQVLIWNSDELRESDDLQRSKAVGTADEGIHV